MDESDRSTNQKQGATIRSYLLHSSLGAVLGFILPFANMLDQKHWTKLACFDLSSSNFNMQGYILSTGGVALRRFQHPFIFLCYLLVIQIVFQNSFRSLFSKSGKIDTPKKEFVSSCSVKKIHKLATNSPRKKKCCQHDVKYWKW
jgi:hypothetical protein